MQNTLSPSPAPAATQAPAHASRLIVLVTLAVFINYVDRGNLATAAPLLQTDLGLSATELGILLSAFFYTYVAFMPVTGWLAEHFGVRRVFAAGVAIWSLATLLSGFASGFVALLLLRLLLGAGESVGFPCASKVLATNVPVERLGVANGVMSFGYLLGPAIGTLLGGYLMAVLGWRPVFVLFGAVSLLWLWPWFRTPVDAPRRVETATNSSIPPMRAILRQRALWGASLGHFSGNYTWYFVLSWLPFYLVKSRGFSIGSMALIASWSYLLTALCALAMGSLTDRWIRAGQDTTQVYKSAMGGFHAVALGCMLAMVTLPELGCVVALFVYSIANGFASPGYYAIPQIIAGPDAAGRWVGIQNMFGNFAGVVAPFLTGVLVDRSGNFELAFGIAAAVNVLGFAGWVLLLPAVRPIAWAASTTAGGQGPGDTPLQHSTS